MKHTFRSSRLLALLLALVMVISMFPAQVFAAEGTTIVGNPERVQLGADAAAQRVNDFNKGWKFYLGDNSNASNQNFDDSQWDNVNLPHDFSITQHFTASGEAESGFLPGGTGWYRKSFTISEEAAGKTFLLNFDGVYKDSYVYVNGTFVGEHHYGYSNFAFDISDYLVCDGATQNVVAVKVINQLPSSRWYSGSGIYRDVTLYALDPVHVDLNGVQITTPDIADGDGTAAVKVDVVNDGITAAEVTVRTTIGGVVGETSVTVPGRSSAEAELEVEVSSPALWSLENPNLYTAVTEVLVNGDVVDSCEDTFGYRWFSWSSQGFQLNGQNVKLNGVCLHHDQGALGAAAYYDAMYRQLSIMKDMGCNAIRTSHNPADEQFIQICSELGLLVIEEHFDGITAAKNGNSNDFAKYFAQPVNSGLYGAESGMICAEYVVRSIVKRDRNEASIFAWSYGNEIQEGASAEPQFVTYCEQYINWTGEEDGSRIVTIGDNSKGSGTVLQQVLTKILESGGVVGFNYHCHQANSQTLLSNWGGQWGTILASETSSHTNSRGRYQSLASNTSIDGAYHLTSYDTSSVGWGDPGHDSMWDTLTKDYIAGEFVWTGFDYIGEPTPWNGTGTGDGGRGAIPNSSYFGIVETTGFPKDTYYLYRAQWNQAVNTVHLVTAWDSDNQYVSGGKTPVWVYTNAAQVKLYLNGDLIGTTNRTVNTTDAGHVYYTYSATSNNTNVCTAAANSGADSLYTIFNVAYTAGTLTAAAYDESGSLMDTYSVYTPGTVTKLKASADKTEIDANGYDLVYVEVDVTDDSGILDTTATNNITFTVSGPAEIAGVDNGDQATVRKYQNSYVLTDRQHANINAYAGKALVILRATEEGGEITLNIASEGLEGKTITINAVGGESGDDTGLVSYEMVRDYTVKAGTEPTLGTAITGYLADGSEVEGSVTWRTVSEDLYNAAGDYTISGTASFDGYEDVRVSARLHVIPNVIALRNVAAVTMEGIAPVLPEMVSGVLANGELSGEFQVEWNEVAASEYDTVGETVVVSGTAVIFGEEALDVTCTVRVAEAINTDSVNVAGAARLSQDVPENMQSDNLNAINDGTRNPSGDNENDRWTNWKNRYQNANATITLVWDTAQLLSDVNLFYRYDGSCKKPEAIVFRYSLNGTDFQEVGYTESALSDISVNNGAAFTYALEEVINPVALQITFTQQGGTSSGYCVGLYEVEAMTYAATLEKQSSAALSAIKVSGTAIEGFDPTVYNYDIADGEVTAEAAENVGITILPALNGYIRILTVSEDGASANTYVLAVSGVACKHENTESIPAVPATCTDKGLSEGTKCADCGEILVPQEEVPALGHTEEIVPGTPATFDEAGTSDGKRCSVCGLTLEQNQPIPALDYNEGIIPISALTATAGDSHSGEGPERVLDDDFSTLWHTYWYGTSRENHWIQFEISGDYAVDGLRLKPRSSGGQNGIITQYDIQVSNDGVTFTSVASGSWAVDSKWKVVEFEPQVVKYVRLVALEGVTDQSYEFSSAAEIRLTGEESDHVHNWSEWTVTTPATCTATGVETRTCECGRTETRDIPMLEHTAGEAVRENVVEATCFAAGSYESVVYCSVCGTQMSRETVTVPALNHANTELRDAMEATCTEAGYTGDTWCLDCGRRLSVGQDIPALDHDWQEDGSCSRCEAHRDTDTTFVDVAPGVFYAEAVEWAVENGITDGITDNMFGPTLACNRAQAVTFLWRAANCPEPTSTNNPFVDVPETAFYYKAVLWAVENGITDGVSEDLFAPNHECTRGQIVTFLWRAAKCPEPINVNNSFVDVTEEAFYYKAVLWAVENGITDGTGTDTFSPNGICNRGQIVTFLFRAYN